MKRGAALALLAFSSACTFEDGKGFATIESARLAARFDPGAARNLNGAVLTDLGYQIRLSDLRLTIDKAALQELSGTTASGGAFDPANPPPGYSLCHGGHCHAADGRLVAYADVEAELAGGGATLRDVVSFEIGSEFELLSGTEQELRSISPSRELPEATLRKAAISGAHFVATAEISGGALADGEAALSVELENVPRFETGLDIDISREGPEELELLFALSLGGALFDGIDFGALVQNGVVRIATADDEAARTLIASLARTSLTVSY